jgi:hypothetical protein
MAFFIDKATGAPQHVELTADLYKAAMDAGLTVPNYVNRTYSSADASHGSAFAQMCASEGLALPSDNNFGIRAATLGDILDGKAGMQAAGVSNNSDRGSPFGSAARVLAPAAIIEITEDILQRDRDTDFAVYGQMIAQEISIGSENFIQPVVSYQTVGGPEQAKPQRAAEFSEPGNMLRLSTAERIRTLPTFSMGIEFSDKAKNALTIDVLAMSIARYMAVELDGRVYSGLSALFSGDSDLVVGAISAVTTTSLDAAATGGVVTHKSWVKFLARNRKYRRITHIICDVDTYLKIESRTGRPGSNNYDPTLSRIDPQAVAANMNNIGFGNDVKFFIVDAAVDGGPVPANTVWALDGGKAITRVKNSSADYTASEAFALRRSTAMRWDYSEAVYRALGDTELRPFDVLTIL